MTREEFNTLPDCIRYANPSNDCTRLDDWGFSDYEDPCEGCSSRKWNNKEEFMAMTLAEAREYINKHIKK